MSVSVKMARVVQSKVAVVSTVFFVCLHFACCNNGRRVSVKCYNIDDITLNAVKWMLYLLAI